MGRRNQTSGGENASGEAGRRGDDVRSDVWVRVEIRAKGGVDISLDSRVEPYYGDSIRDQVRSILSTAGVEHARVEVEDSGALPFAIAARVDAAMRGAGIEVRADALSEPAAPLPPASARDRLRRSRLYLPGDEPKYFINAGLHGPDGIILDLEDSVHPSAKDAARLLVRNALHSVDFRGAERMVRINPLPRGLEDLEAVAPRHPEMILIPKVEHPDQVREIDGYLAEILGTDDRPMWLMPILESALGIERAFEIASASERIAALTIGLEDYAADIGVPKSAGGEESLYARARVVNAARAAGVQAIDSVFGQVDDTEGLQRWAAGSRSMGFVGMGCVHPRQIEPIHAAYNPTAAEIDRALSIVSTFERARSEGLGVVSLGSKMIDPPVIRQAQRLVEQARALGLLAAGAPGTDEESGS